MKRRPFRSRSPYPIQAAVSIRPIYLFIFEHFYKADKSRQRAMEAPGLPALVKNYIELHGGTDFVESETGKGSTFCFTVPVQS